MEKKIENEMETGIIGFIVLKLFSIYCYHFVMCPSWLPIERGKQNQKN